MRDPTDEEKRAQALAWLPADNKMATSFGMRFGRKACGKEVTVGGRVWVFGRRGNARSSCFEVRVKPKR